MSQDEAPKPKASRLRPRSRPRGPRYHRRRSRPKMPPKITTITTKIVRSRARDHDLGPRSRPITTITSSRSRSGPRSRRSRDRDHDLDRDRAIDHDLAVEITIDPRYHRQIGSHELEITIWITILDRDLVILRSITTKIVRSRARDHDLGPRSGQIWRDHKLEITILGRSITILRLITIKAT